jgi:translation initiation factor eIF-2B subunit delta
VLLKFQKRFFIANFIIYISNYSMIALWFTLDSLFQAAKRRRQRLRQKENSLKVEKQEEGEEIMDKAGSDKTKEQILAERQAKKAEKMQKSKKESGEGSAKAVPVKQIEKKADPVKTNSPQKVKSPSVAAPVVQNSSASVAQTSETPKEGDKSKDQVQSDRKARKQEKQSAKKKVDAPSEPIQASAKVPVTKTNSDVELAVKMENLHIADDENKAKPALSKAERRAIQEAQRAAKAKALEEKKSVKPVAKKTLEASIKKPQTSPKKAIVTKPSASALHKVKLFKHLYSDKCDLNIKINQNLHPAIVKLGLQYANDTVVGSNARCYAFLNAMKIVS